MGHEFFPLRGGRRGLDLAQLPRILEPPAIGRRVKCQKCGEWRPAQAVFEFRKLENGIEYAADCCMEHWVEALGLEWRPR